MFVRCRKYLNQLRRNAAKMGMDIFRFSSVRFRSLHLKLPLQGIYFLWKILKCIRFQSHISSIYQYLQGHSVQICLKRRHQYELFTDSKYILIIVTISKGHIWVSFWKTEIHPLLSLKDVMEQYFMKFWIY